MRYLVIAVFALLLVVAGLALGVAFAPQMGEANCHQFSLPPVDPDRGSPINPLRCKPDGVGGVKCSYLY